MYLLPSELLVARWLDLHRSGTKKKELRVDLGVVGAAELSWEEESAGQKQTCFFEALSTLDTVFIAWIWLLVVRVGRARITLLLLFLHPLLPSGERIRILGIIPGSRFFCHVPGHRGARYCIHIVPVMVSLARVTLGRRQSLSIVYSHHIPTHTVALRFTAM